MLLSDYLPSFWREFYLLLREYLNLLHLIEWHSQFSWFIILQSVTLIFDLSIFGYPFLVCFQNLPTCSIDPTLHFVFGYILLSIHCFLTLSVDILLFGKDQARSILNPSADEYL